MDDAISLLCGERIGLTLIGDPNRIHHMLPSILEHIVARPMLPVHIQSATASCETLRESVEHAHAARPGGVGDILLVIEDAHLLSPLVLAELELAAAAASSAGGLRFLFTAPQDFSHTLERRHLDILAECVRTRLTLPAVRARANPPLRPFASAAPSGPPVRVARHVMLASGVLGALGLLVAAGIVTHAGRSIVPLIRTQAPPVRMTGTRTAIRFAETPDPASLQAKPQARPAQLFAVASAPAPSATASVTVIQVPITPRGASLLLIAPPGETLLSLYGKVYRGGNAPPYQEVATLNPTVIHSGSRLIFPPPATGWPVLGVSPR